ncbi:MAG: hypothetical protein IJH39_11630 [Clostridia bacterium]|nr:hypothetical protein [Clostridia bacterium]
MNKEDYKGYELIKEITDGKIKDGTKIEVHDLVVLDKLVAIIEYKNKKIMWKDNFDTSYLLNPNCYFKIIQEQQDIDIQNIQELLEIESYEVDNTDVKLNRQIINKLVQAVKKLDKDINYIDN